MFRNLLVWLVGLSLVGCTSMNQRQETPQRPPADPNAISTIPGMEVSTETSLEDMPKDVRLAQAQLMSGSGENIVGTVNFEQMPNSVIVTYRLEGLTPKKEYQIFVKEQSNCANLDASPAVGLKELRASKLGTSENTFKTESFTVAGKQSLLGKSVIIAGRGGSAAAHGAASLACGQVLPLVPTTPAVE